MLLLTIRQVEAPPQGADGQADQPADNIQQGPTGNTVVRFEKLKNVCCVCSNTSIILKILQLTLLC